MQARERHGRDLDIERRPERDGHRPARGRFIECCGIHILLETFSRRTTPQCGKNYGPGGGGGAGAPGTPGAPVDPAFTLIS